MFLGDQIDCLIEELWQLAMTMASLKYIAGMVSQDWEVTRAFTGLDLDNKHTTESHRPSQVDKTEADSDKCLAKHEIIASEEASQNNETASPTLITGLAGDEENGENEISMVAHQLPVHDISEESSEIAASMAVHQIAYNDVTEDQTSISMISHQISDVYKLVESEYDDLENIDEKVNNIVFSMCAHELNCIEALQESSEYQVSMVAHFQNRSEEEFIEIEACPSSMVSHKAEESNTIKEDLEENDLEMEEMNNAPTSIEMKRADLSVGSEKTQIMFYSSMASHQLSFIETPAEFSEIPVTMVTHCTTKDQEYFMEDQTYNSMLVHQNICGGFDLEETVLTSSVLNDIDEEPYELETVIANHHEDKTENENLYHEDYHQMIEYDKSNEETYKMQNEAEFEDGDNEHKYFPSMLANKVSIMDIPLELSEIPVSLCTHFVNSNNIDETAELIDNHSMLAHHITKEAGYLENTNEVVYSISSKDSEAVADPETIKTNTPRIDKISSQETSLVVPLHSEESKVEQIAENFTTDLLLSKEAYNPPFSPSFVAHQLPPMDTLLEPSDMPVSMLSHFIYKVEDTEIPEKISMNSHQITIGATDLQTDCMHEFKNEVSEVNEVNNEEECIYYLDCSCITSLRTHEIIYSEIVGESSDCPASMVSHNISIPDEPSVDAISMVCHQIVADNDGEKNINGKADSFAEHQHNETEEEGETFVTTMTSHQLPPSDNPPQSPIISVSMASHIHKNDELTIETQQHTTMIAHQTNSEDCLEFEAPGAFTEDVRIPSLINDNYNIPTEQHQNAVSSEQIGDHLKTDPDILECGPSIVFSLEETVDEREQTTEPYTDEQLEDEECSFSLSMVTHKLPCIEIPMENTEFLSSSVSHGFFPINEEEFSPSSSMLAHQHLEHKTNENSTVESSLEEGEEASKHFSSLASHQLPDSCASNYDGAFYALSHSSQPTENCDSESSILVHNFNHIEDDTEDMSEHYQEPHIPLMTHQIKTSKTESDMFDTKTPVNNCYEFHSQTMTEQAKNEEIVENQKMVENGINSYTAGNIKDDVENCFQEERPVVVDFINENNNNVENVALKSPFTSRLTRIQKLQRLVEDEIEEFENKRKNNVKQIDNAIETTETHIVNNVKNIEFKSCIVTHQKLNDAYNDENFPENSNEGYLGNSTDNESMLSSCESLNSVICTTSESIKCNGERIPDIIEDSEMYSDQENEEASVIQASCTLEDNSPVVITASQLPSTESTLEEISQDLPEEQSFNENNNDEKTDGQQTIEENEEFDELKMQLRKTPRRSSNATTKIREMELLSSFLNEGSKEIKEKCKIKPQEKKRKSSITLATLNESVKKQTYKIRFKVSLNKDNSKSSVLQYLFGCFGGEKLFHQK